MALGVLWDETFRRPSLETLLPVSVEIRSPARCRELLAVIDRGLFAITRDRFAWPVFWTLQDFTGLWCRSLSDLEQVTTIRTSACRFPGRLDFVERVNS